MGTPGPPMTDIELAARRIDPGRGWNVRIIDLDTILNR